MTITMTLKKKWFDQIKSGEKTIEYREFKSYWITRLVKDEPVTSIIFINGYQKDSPKIKADVKKIEIIDAYKNGKWITDLKFIDKVFAIHLCNAREIT